MHAKLKTTCFLTFVKERRKFMMFHNDLKQVKVSTKDGN